MRTKGKITHWKHDKGYGFITPEAGAKQVFVHISSFQYRQSAPRVNQLLSFHCLLTSKAVLVL
jgi:cold shock CspA family protein